MFYLYSDKELSISRPTFFRDIEYLKNRFNAPIEYDHQSRGYRFDPGADRFELPGIWLTSSEAHAMLAMHQLLDDVQPGLLKPLLQPLYERLEKSLVFYNRERDETTTREVSPQRLVHYRDNWYLDTYDHMRKGLRTFSLDCIREVRLMAIQARNIPEQKLNRELGRSYGIFAGKPTQTAVLRFTAFRARWVAREQWHPEQRGKPKLEDWDKIQLCAQALCLEEMREVTIDEGALWY